MGKDEFIGIIIRISWRCQDSSIDQDLIKIIHVHAYKLGSLLNQEYFLLEEDDREFSADIGFAQGKVIGKVDRDLHNSCSIIGGIVVPQGFYGADASRFDICEDTVETVTDSLRLPVLCSAIVPETVLLRDSA